MIRLALIVGLFLAGALTPGAGELAHAQDSRKFSVRPAGAAESWRPVVGVREALRDPALVSAVESGLPLRVRLRVELWKNELFDRLLGAQELSLALVQDPLDGAYVVEIGRAERRFSKLEQAQNAIEDALRPSLRPTGRGPLYYLATLELETLSLSDLEELRRWLRGEAGPAIGGGGSPERALARGMSRVLVRVLGLPTRRYEARSDPFDPR